MAIFKSPTIPSKLPPLGSKAKTGTYIPPAQASGLPMPGSNAQPTGFNWGAGNADNSMSDFTRTAEWLPYGIQSQLGGLAQMGVNDLYSAQGDYQNARRRALMALDPGAAWGQLQAQGQRQMGLSADLGRKNAAALRGQGIMGADAAAMLDAQNQGAEATSNYANSLFSPEGVAGRAVQSMQLNSPDAVFPMLSKILGIDEAVLRRIMENNGLHAQRAASSGLGGALGQILGSLGGLNFGGAGTAGAVNSATQGALEGINGLYG